MPTTCPQCGRILSKADVYFCSGCGAVISSPQSVGAKRYYDPSGGLRSNPSSNKNGQVISIKGFIIGFFVFLILAASAIVSSYATEKIVTQGGSVIAVLFPGQKSETDSVNTAVAEETKQKVAPEDSIKYLPFDTDFAAVFYSPEDFADSLAYLGLQNTFDMDFLKNANRPPYITLVTPGEMRKVTLLFFPSSGVSASYKKYVAENFTEMSSDSVILLTENEEVGKEIIDISSGLKKGLNLNSNYSNIKNRIPENVRSKIFVFTDDGVGYVNSLKVDNMPESFKALIMNYMSSGSYYGYLEYGRK